MSGNWIAFSVIDKFVALNDIFAAKMSSKMPKKARKAEKSQIVSNDSILPPNIIIRSKKKFAQPKPSYLSPIWTLDM